MLIPIGRRSVTANSCAGTVLRAGAFGNRAQHCPMNLCPRSRNALISKKKESALRQIPSEPHAASFLSLRSICCDVASRARPLAHVLNAVIWSATFGRSRISLVYGRQRGGINPSQRLRGSAADYQVVMSQECLKLRNQRSRSRA